VGWPTRIRVPSLEPRVVTRNFALDVVGALGVGVTGALVTILIPTVARRGGLDAVGLAALTAIPFLANLLSAYAGRLGPRNPRQLAAMRGAGASTLLVLLVAPLPPAMLIVVLVYMLSLSFSNPFQLRLWGALYPAGVLGRVIGVLGMSRAAAGAGAALLGGVLADALGVPAAIAVSGVIGLACAIAYAGQRARSSDPVPAYSARESLLALRSSRAVSRLALAQGFFGGGLIAAVPLYALVHVDRLHLSLGEVGVIGISISAATMVSFPAWGTFSDRFGPAATLRLGSVLGIAALVGYAFAPSLALLIPVAMALGAANASLDVGLGSFISAEIPLATRAAAQAGWNAVTGARGIVAAFAPSVLLSLGLVDVTTGMLLCAASAVVGAALFLRIQPAARTTRITDGDVVAAVGHLSSAVATAYSE
jgi:MFS family permease